MRTGFLIFILVCLSKKSEGLDEKCDILNLLDFIKKLPCTQGCNFLNAPDKFEITKDRISEALLSLETLGCFKQGEIKSLESYIEQLTKIAESANDLNGEVLVSAITDARKQSSSNVTSLKGGNVNSGFGKELKDAEHYVKAIEEFHQAKDLDCKQENKRCQFVKDLAKYVTDFDLKHYGQFDVEWQERRNKLAEKLIALDPQDFKYAAKALITDISELKDRKSLELVQYGIKLASEERNDGGINVRIEDLIDELKVAPEPTLFSDYADYLDIDGDWRSLHIPSRVTGDEAKLDYFREDNDVHVMHAYWHDLNKIREPKHRMYQRFFYFHNIFLRRYELERLNEGLPDLQPFSPHQQMQIFSTEYNINDENDPHGLLNDYHSPKQECKLKKKSINSLTRTLRMLYNSLLKPLEEYGRIADYGYHARLHNTLRTDCDFGLMESFAVSARPPVFFRIHGEINRMWFKYFERTEYSFYDVMPPRGIAVHEISLHSRCSQKNQVETFWEKVGHQYKLNHQAYNISIRIMNPYFQVKKIIMRIFIGSTKTGLEKYIEIDRFTYNLNGHPQQLINRLDFDSTFLNKMDINDCGWPYHLFLPKGGNRKPIQFRLVVFVSDVADQRVNVGEHPVLNTPMCGASVQELRKNKLWILEDDKEYGFPFNRKWNFDPINVINNQNRYFGASVQELRKNKLWILEDDKEYGFPFNRKWNFDPINVINNQNRYFGAISTILKIVHTGEETMECVPEMFQDGGLKPQTINQNFFFDSKEERDNDLFGRGSITRKLVYCPNDDQCYRSIRPYKVSADINKSDCEEMSDTKPVHIIESAVLRMMNNDQSAFYWLEQTEGGRCKAVNFIGEEKLFPCMDKAAFGLCVGPKKQGN